MSLPLASRSITVNKKNGVFHLRVQIHHLYKPSILLLATMGDLDCDTLKFEGRYDWPHACKTSSDHFCVVRNCSFVFVWVALATCHLSVSRVGRRCYKKYSQCCHYCYCSPFNGELTRQWCIWRAKAVATMPRKAYRSSRRNSIWNTYCKLLHVCQKHPMKKAACKTIWKNSCSAKRCEKASEKPYEKPVVKTVWKLCEKRYEKHAVKNVWKTCWKTVWTARWKMCWKTCEKRVKNITKNTLCAGSKELLLKSSTPKIHAKIHGTYKPPETSLHFDIQVQLWLRGCPTAVPSSRWQYPTVDTSGRSQVGRSAQALEQLGKLSG